MNKNDNHGIFISFEGSEGCGKTTQINRLADRLQKANLEVVATREPGGTDIGEEIRHLLKHASAAENMCPESELLLFAASRAQLVREVIAPALLDGKVVLCDRFLDSTTVYQGVARELSADPVQSINKFAVGDLMPDLTIVMDIPAELGLERIKQRTSALPDRLEQESIDFYQRVREGYLLLAKSMPKRFLVIDGSRDPSVIEKEIYEKVSDRFFKS